jgi:hypothetical protein
MNGEETRPSIYYLNKFSPLKFKEVPHSVRFTIVVGRKHVHLTLGFVNRQITIIIIIITTIIPECILMEPDSINLKVGTSVDCGI